MKHQENKKNKLSLLSVDFTRLFKSKLFYILLGIALLAPVLILVMTTAMDGKVSVDPQTGKETVMQGFQSVWEIFGSLSGSGMSGANGEAQASGMSLTAMCNINLLFFAVVVFVCLFVADDFRSGFCKNIFSVRQGKGEYILSKTLLSLFLSALLFFLFFVGALVGGKISSLPFAMDSFTLGNLLLCLLSKIALSGLFISLSLLCASFAKEKAWLSLLLSAALSTIFFMTASLLTPLNASLIHLFGCIAVGAVCSIGFGLLSALILRKTPLA